MKDQSIANKLRAIIIVSRYNDIRTELEGGFDNNKTHSELKSISFRFNSTTQVE